MTSLAAKELVDAANAVINLKTDSDQRISRIKKVREMLAYTLKEAMDFVDLVEQCAKTYEKDSFAFNAARLW